MNETSSFWDDSLMMILGYGAEKERGEILTQQLVDVTQARYNAGYSTYEEYQARKNAVVTNGSDISSYRLPSLSPTAGFAEGFEEGKNNVKTAIGSTITETLKTVTGIIPWQLWAILGAVAVLYLAPIFIPMIAGKK